LPAASFSLAPSFFYKSTFVHRTQDGPPSTRQSSPPSKLVFAGSRRHWRRRRPSPPRAFPFCCTDLQPQSPPTSALSPIHIILIETGPTSHLVAPLSLERSLHSQPTHREFPFVRQSEKLPPVGDHSSLYALCLSNSSILPFSPQESHRLQTSDYHLSTSGFPFPREKLTNLPGRVAPHHYIPTKWGVE